MFPTVGSRFSAWVEQITRELLLLHVVGGWSSHRKTSPRNDHPNLSVLSTKRSLVGSISAVVAPVLCAPKALAYFHRFLVHHAFLGVLRAELPLLAARHAERRVLRAPFPPTLSRGLQVHHVLVSVLRAVLSLSDRHAVARVLVAPLEPAPPHDLEVNHPLPGVPAAKLSLAAARHAERGVLRAALVRAPLAADVDHPLGRVLGTKLSPRDPPQTVGGLLRAARVFAPSSHARLLVVADPSKASPAGTSPKARWCRTTAESVFPREACSVRGGGGREVCCSARKKHEQRQIEDQHIKWFRGGGMAR